MEKLADLFPELSTYVAESYRTICITKPTLMVAMTARTGSTLLCTTLGKLLDAGEPTEIFNPRGVVQWERQRRGVSSFGEYLASLQNDGRDWFSFKVNWVDFGSLAPFCKILFPNLRVIYLDRIDVEAQAVSLYKATITDRWHERREAKTPPHRSTDVDLTGRFDIVKICQTITDLEIEKRSWRNFFFENEIYPLYLDYENLSECFVRALRYIMAWLNIEMSGSNLPEAEYVKLADSLNDEWINKTKNYRSGKFCADQKEKCILP